MRQLFDQMVGMEMGDDPAVAAAMAAIAAGSSPEAAVAAAGAVDGGVGAAASLSGPVRVECRRKVGDRVSRSLTALELLHTFSTLEFPHTCFNSRV